MTTCKCGCGEESSRNFLPGHDQKLRITLEHQVGGLLSLRGLVESAKSYANGELSDEALCQTVREVFR